MMTSHRTHRGQSRISRSGSLNMPLGGRSSIKDIRVKTRLAQVWCKGPTCRKSLAAFGRKCVQLHCKVRILLHRWQTPNRVAQELSWQGADCETSKAGDQVAHLAYSNLPPSSIQRPDLVSNIIRAHCMGTSPGGSTQPQQTTVILI